MVVTLTLQEEHAQLLLSALKTVVRASDDSTILVNAGKAVPIAVLIEAAIVEAKAKETPTPQPADPVRPVVIKELVHTADPVPWAPDCHAE